ncbi:MAG TPA: hypothetical protein VHG72_03960 [Polyangia bacterium]|nr:hypothetical protein [Polyangia bacterium]
MDHMTNVIPISSRRPGPVPIARPVVSAPAVRRGWSVALLFGAALVLCGVVAVSRVQTIGSIRGLPLAERGALYQRTIDDTSAACGTPDARGGALRDHCLQQAEFLRLFPECDGRCQKLTASILPRAAR